MGLFSWLFGKSEPVPFTSRVWLTEAARGKALVREIRQHLKANRAVLLLAHFPSTLEALTVALCDRNLTCERFPTPLTPAGVLREIETRRSPTILAGLVRDLLPEMFPSDEECADAGMEIVVAEMHFLRRHDDTVIAFAGEIGTQCQVTFHTSLEAPLMTMRVGEGIKGILRQLGMQEDEVIESRMVTRRIRRTQDKIAAQVDEDQPTDSPEEWVTVNLGDQ